MKYDVSETTIATGKSTKVNKFLARVANKTPLTQLSSAAVTKAGDGTRTRDIDLSPKN